MRKIYLIIAAFLLSGFSFNPEQGNVIDVCWDQITNAVKFREQEKYEASLNSLEAYKACVKSEVELEYLYHKGWTYHEMEEYLNAAREFTNAIKVQPEYIFSYWRLGLSLEAMGQINHAQSSYKMGYETGVIVLGDTFFEVMDKNPSVKEKLIQEW